MLKSGQVGKKGHLLSFTHSNIIVGPAPWAQKVWGALGCPLCPRKALKWGADLGSLESPPKHPQGDRKGMME
jgi:hypothetical protein